MRKKSAGKSTHTELTRTSAAGISAYVLVVILACMLAVFLASCGTGYDGKEVPDGESGSGNKAGKSASDKKQSQKKKIRLRYGKRVKVDKKGFVTRKSVYKMKSGVRLSRKDIKKTGGVKKWFLIFKIKKGDRVYRRIEGKSYKDNPNIKCSDLRYIKTLYYDFSGKIRVGEIIVNKSIAKDTRAVFRELYKKEYQIKKMVLIDKYYPKLGASGTAAGNKADEASMNDDNTSGFNYRMVAGTSTVSMHGYGRAIDVNPFENPWCPGGKLSPNQSRSAEYANRSVRRPHMIFADSNITRIFKKYGFRWLGETGTRDYQHFEK